MVTASLWRVIIIHLSYYLFQGVSFTLHSLIIIPQILLAISGIITCLYHFKTYAVIVHTENNSEDIYPEFISKTYWQGAISFGTIWIIYVIIAAQNSITFQENYARNIGSTIGAFLVLCIGIWTIHEVRKMKRLYNQAIRPKANIIDHIGKE